MRKKLLFSILTFISLIFSFSFVFAADNMQDASNTIRNAVGGAENAVEDAAEGATDAAKDAANTVTDATKNTVDNAENAVKDDNSNQSVVESMTNDDNYTATRTSADATFMGMNATTWTWLIMGIVAIAIVALVWYYSTQLTERNYHDNNE